MIVLSLLLALAGTVDTLPREDTTTYATPELRALILEAAEQNRRVPEALGGYRARLESEISIGNRRAEEFCELQYDCRGRWFAQILDEGWLYALIQQYS